MFVTRTVVSNLRQDNVNRFHRTVSQKEQSFGNATASKFTLNNQLTYFRHDLQSHRWKRQTGLFMPMRHFFERSGNGRHFGENKKDFRSEATSGYLHVNPISSLHSIAVHNALVCLLLGSLLIAAYATSAEQDSSLSDERIRALLDKKNRNTEETLELYELILKRGMEVAKQVEGKDVLLLLGDTSAGKTSFANFLRGCSFIKVGDDILVDPQSSVKPVGKIGTKPESETYVPEKFPEITDFIFSPFKLAKEKIAFVPIDFPGTKDTHGIAVEGPTAEAIRQITLKAKSVRIVLIVEYDHTSKAGKGAKWREIVELFDHRFHGLIGRGEKDFCVLITKTQDKESAIERIKWASGNQGCVDFSPYVEIYDPLKPNDRDRLLKTIGTIKAYPGGHLTTNVVLSEDQLFKASKLGDEVANLIERRLQEETTGSMQDAIKKTQFTYRMAKLGNESLTGPHKTVESKVKDRARSVAASIMPNVPNSPPTLTQIEAFQKYKTLKSHFVPFEISFGESDGDVRNAIRMTSKKEKSRVQEIGNKVTGVGLVATGVGAFVQPLLVVGPVVSGVGLLIKAAGAARRAWWRSPDEKQRDTFFKGP